MVTDCDQLTDCQIVADYPEKIQIENLNQLRAFALDLACKKCILELDRYDVNVFNFATETSQLESFYLRTGTKSDFNSCNGTHERYQAVKWQAKNTFQFDVTHSIDLIRVKAYLVELFPFMASFVQQIETEAKVTEFSNDEAERKAKLSVRDSFNDVVAK